MFRLENWYLTGDSERFIGNGHCYGNPKFAEGLFINTSLVVSIEVEREEKRLKLFTFSGSCYVLDFADIDEDHWECTKEILEQADSAVDWEECLVLKKQKEEAYQKKLADVLKPNELYVVMSGAQGIVRAYFKTNENSIIPIQADVHGGMMKDSIILAEAGVCDWRIYASLLSARLYHWSDNIGAVHIENVGNDFWFLGFGEGGLCCKSGEVTLIKKGEYMEEGLVSPDAFNGKSVFSDHVSDWFSEKPF
ncbi:MAG: hypothetical protein NC548_25350 [Lachnospiraceae bacterium]|nr:hypothetical protein [Lachnospiraceae bacterium]